MLIVLCYPVNIQVCPLSFSLYPVLFTAAGVSVSCTPFGGARHKHEAQGTSILRNDWALSGAKYKWELGKARFDCTLIGKTRAQSGRFEYEDFDMLLLEKD
jgi:hypothetical protein